MQRPCRSLTHPAPAIDGRLAKLYKLPFHDLLHLLRLLLSADTCG